MDIKKETLREVGSGSAISSGGYKSKHSVE